MKRGAAPIALAALLAAVTACDGAAGRRSGTAADIDGDEWGENETPPTRDEVLAAPSQHDADAVAAALVAVTSDADAAALPRVLAVAGDDREEVRWHAVLALRAIGGERAQAALARLAASDPSELVRDEAAAGTIDAARQGGRTR